MLLRLVSTGARMLIASDPADFIAAYAKLRPALIAQIDTANFDADWYVRLYPDVSVALASGCSTSAYDHYERVGFLAGRLGCPMPLDESWYTTHYKDISNALNRGTILSAKQHFRDHGFFEGRAASGHHLTANAWYKKSYPSAEFEIEMGYYVSVQDHYNRRGYGLGYWASPDSLRAL